MRSIFEVHRLDESAIAGVATIDTKVNEAGLIEFCCDRSLPLFFYAAERLRSVVVPHASSAIEEAIGTPSVAEAAALLACWEAGGGGELTAETQRRGESYLKQFPTPYTLHPIPVLHVPKQCYRSAETRGAVTIAVVLEG
jgi:cobalt-precorrin 5A hydrolase/precorrin-3B C17-methyltransferase